MAVIFFYSGQSDPSPGLSQLGHVVAHFTEYAILAGLWCFALVPTLGAKGLVAAAAISILYAVSDEIHQSFVDGRDSDPVDVLVDSAGVAAAVGLSYLLWRQVHRRPSP